MLRVREDNPSSGYSKCPKYMRHRHWRWRTRSALFPARESPLRAGGPSNKTIPKVAPLRYRSDFLPAPFLRTLSRSDSRPSGSTRAPIRARGPGSPDLSPPCHARLRALLRTCPVAADVEIGRNPPAKVVRHPSVGIPQV